jgi:hypothetical protein
MGQDRIGEERRGGAGKERSGLERKGQEGIGLDWIGGERQGTAGTEINRINLNHDQLETGELKWQRKIRFRTMTRQSYASQNGHPTSSASRWADHRLYSIILRRKHLMKS